MVIFSFEIMLLNVVEGSEGMCIIIFNVKIYTVEENI